MFGTLGGPELFLIFVVALIVFGPRKLPEIGKSLGRMITLRKGCGIQGKSLDDAMGGIRAIDATAGASFFEARANY